MHDDTISGDGDLCLWFKCSDPIFRKLLKDFAFLRSRCVSGNITTLELLGCYDVYCAKVWIAATGNCRIDVFFKLHGALRSEFVNLIGVM